MRDKRQVKLRTCVGINDKPIKVCHACYQALRLAGLLKVRVYRPRKTKDRKI